MPERIAAIDVGTNTVKLAIAERTADGRLAPVLDTSRTVRLGEAMYGDRLRELAMRRTLDVLADFAAYCAAHHVSRLAAVGTAALRAAINRDAFLGRAAQAGVPIEVISGEEEARLSFLAVRRDHRWLSAASLLVIDIGGGSTEVITGTRFETRRRSAPLGAVKLTEACLRADPPTIREMAAANAAACAAAAETGVAPGTWTAVCVGGTAVNLAAVKLGLAVQEPEHIHGVSLSQAEVERQVALYAERTVEERKAIAGLDPERADVILGGAIILAQLMAALGLTEVAVSTRGLRWGVLYDRLA